MGGLLLFLHAMTMGTSVWIKYDTYTQEKLGTWGELLLGYVVCEQPLPGTVQLQEFALKPCCYRQFFETQIPSVNLM